MRERSCGKGGTDNGKTKKISGRTEYVFNYYKTDFNCVDYKYINES